MPEADNTPAPQDNTHLSRQSEEEMIRDFIQLQREQADVRREELELQQNELLLRKQIDGNQFDLAKRSLQANENDREKERQNRQKLLSTSLVGIGVIVFLLLLFCGFAVYCGKENVVLEGLKIVGAFLAGGLGGYGFGKSKTSSNDTSSDTPAD